MEANSRSEFYTEREIMNSAAVKGTYCSIPIDWSKVVPGAREEALSLCGDGCSEQACRAIEETRLRRSDKVYIWPEV